mmetsp:Transcript_29841/g.44107  ORF Transcript_29841/g.44107 Transcript_29841/m.44107 type:complete len:112 (-) Transcript_29841:20-355(-)
MSQCYYHPSRRYVGLDLFSRSVDLYGGTETTPLYVSTLERNLESRYLFAGRRLRVENLLTRSTVLGLSAQPLDRSERRQQRVDFLHAARQSAGASPELRSGSSGGLAGRVQ